MLPQILPTSVQLERIHEGDQQHTHNITLWHVCVPTVARQMQQCILHLLLSSMSLSTI